MEIAQNCHVGDRGNGTFPPSHGRATHPIKLFPQSNIYLITRVNLMS